MHDLFTRLPGAVSALVGAHIMTFLFLAAVGVCLAWVAVFMNYQARQRRQDQRRQDHRRKPGAFPGDQH